jgi:hypothetical protein
MTTTERAGMSQKDIFWLVEKYIGVDGGYLLDFSYSKHARFYPAYCDLDIDPTEFGDSTQRRFIKVLQTQKPTDQAKILGGVLEYCEVGSRDFRTEKSAAIIRRIISRLEGQVVEIELTVTSTRAALHKTMEDARLMIEQGNPENAVDRIHTAFHDHLKAIWDDLQWAYDPLTSPGKLFRELVKHHSVFRDHVVRGQDIQKILRGLSALIDALNPIRNNASLSHPVDSLLDEPEALLYVNAVRTLMQYMDQKLGQP